MASILRNMINTQAALQEPNRVLRLDASLPLAQGYESGHIIGQLGRQDRRPEPSRVHAGYIHASSLGTMCGRKHQLANRLNFQGAVERVTGGHRVMWAIGKAIETHVRDSYVVQTGGAGVWGDWVCDCGHHRVSGTTPGVSARCAHCRTVPSHYREHTLQDDVHGIMGNPDLVLLEGGRMLVVEIKSIKAKGDTQSFESISRNGPMPDHVLQASIYRRMLRDLGYPVSNLVVVFYCSKDFKWGNPYKEWAVLVQDDDPLVQTLLDRARDVHEDDSSGALMPRMCTDPNSGKAKACPLLTQCFMEPS